MFSEAIPGNLRSNLELLGKQQFVHQFYLAGGTALALQLGHRISYDLDFFTREEFNENDTINRLRKLGKVEVDVQRKGTFVGKLNDTKISFLFYQYPLIAPSTAWLGIRIADIPDLSCMKLDAIQARGRKRDFVDLWAIIRSGGSLGKTMTLFEKKYSGVRYNRQHLFKSLTYFADAEEDDMPEMLKAVSWDEVKRTLEAEAKKLTTELLKST